MFFFLKRRIKSIDLRLFAVMQMSECWDGKTTVSEGDTWQLLIYNNRVVSKRNTTRIDGSVEQRSVTGRKFWWLAYDISQTYMEILRICRHKYFAGKMPLATELSMDHDGRDIVLINPETFHILQGHPQYLEMVQGFKLNLAPVTGGYRIEVNAFAN